MMAAPRVSVIIPTYRRPALLLACVESILRNDFVDFEILIVDQEATQSLKAELKRRFGDDARLLYVPLENVALDHARNAGIAQARGQILVFTDDDVEVEPGWLRAFVEAFAAIEPPPGVVAGRLSARWIDPRPGWLHEENEVVLGIYDQAGALRPMPDGDLPIGANLAVSRQAANEAGGFDERLDYSHARRASLLSGGDSLFSRKVKERYPIYYQPAARAWHKIGAAKLTKRYNVERNFWEGYTAVSVLHLAGAATRGTALRIACSHAAAIAVHVGRMFVPKKGDAWPQLMQASHWMRGLLRCAHSAGVIAAALKLRWTSVLP